MSTLPTPSRTLEGFMTLYLVERYGVYPRGVVGIYDSYEGARAAADLAKSLEHDDYHSFSITEYELNGGVESFYCSDRTPK